MKAVLYSAFEQLPEIAHVADPTPSQHGVVIAVRATGVCRSDWHGWMGHDPDIRLPHVPGHEFAGEVVATGAGVTRWHIGNRVTVPFVSGCGACPQCASGNHQVCDRQSQPGFTHWGSFAEYVTVEQADINLVALPETLDFATAASLGCRFATSFRAVVDQGNLRGGEWLAVHGCGGVGLSAIMIGAALGANVVAIDIADEKLELAQAVGATAVINSRSTSDVVAAVRDLTSGGAHVSIDALGHPSTCFNSVANLRKRGRHIQVGLLLADQRHPPLPMDQVIANELEIRGSHGMQAHRYPAMLKMIEAGKLRPDQLIGATISLDQAPVALTSLDTFRTNGVTVITSF